MSFLSPAAFSLLALLPVIIVMYLLKLRRQNQPVSSTFLWQRLVRDIEANAPWQKLRNNLIMILQLLFLMVLIFALAEPFVFSDDVGGDSLILIIDSSASMSATDAAPSRLEAAKSQAISFVDAAADETRITLIEAGSQTEILVSASQDRRQIQHAISNIQPGSGSSDMSTALQLTAAITLRQPNTHIYLFSDGKTTLPDHLNLNGSLYYYPIGTKSDNQGISKIQLQQDLSGQNNALFVQVTNYSGEEVERRLEIYVDETLFDVASLTMGDYTQEVYLRNSIPTQAQIVSAKLAGEDFLALDDQAWVIPQNLKPIEILLITNGNRFLETAFQLLPNVNLTVLSPAAFEQPAEPLAPDLTVFDSYTPTDELIPPNSLLFIAPTASTSFFSFIGQIEQPTPRKTDPNDSLLEGIAVSEISILDAAAIPLPDWAKMGISGEADQGTFPLLFYGSTHGQKAAVLSFQLQRSDLPLQVAFPLLIVNLTNWLAPQQIESNPGGEDLGTFSFTVPLTTEQVTVVAPGGGTLRETPDENGLVIINNAPPGIYQVQWGKDSSALAAVNFFSASESDIKPKGQLNVSGTGGPIENSGANQFKQVFWRPIALIALIVLTAEWLVYQRGTLSKLGSGLIRKERV